MYARALIFILAASWLYLAVLLWRIDRRWYARRIVVALVFGIITAACLPLEWGEPDKAMDLFHFLLLMFLSLSFLLFGLYPPYIERRALDSIMSRRGVIPPVIKICLWGMIWDRSFRAVRALEKLVAGRDGGEDELQELLDALNEDAGPRVRSRFLAPILLHRINSRRWEEARSIFESVFPNGEEANESILLLMARPYAELGEFEKGYACLSAARVQGLPSEMLLEWLLAATSLLALAGRGEDLDGFFARHPDSLVYLPTPFTHYWRAVADIAAGRMESARHRFDQATALAPGDPLWMEAIERRLATAEAIQEAASAGLNDSQARDILTLRGDPDEGVSIASLFGRGVAPVTMALVISNIVIWIIMLAPTWGLTGEELMRALIRYGANVSSLVRDGGEQWRLISHMFIHVGILHLLVNAYACYLFGTFVERLCGGRQMFIVYMISGICGGMASAYLAGYDASAGASGAIMGLLGAAIALQFKYRRLMPRSVRNLYVGNFIFMAALTIVFGIMEPQVDNYAHTGGLIAGAVGALVLMRANGDKRAKKSGIHGWAVNLLAAVFLLVLLWAGWNAVSNVLSGGYPKTETPMSARKSAELGVAFDAPGFWREAQLQDRAGFALLDPVGGAAMSVTAYPTDEPADEADVMGLAETLWLEGVTAPDRPRDALRKPSRIELGGRAMYRISYTVVNPYVMPQREIRSDIYVTEVGGRLFIIQFECDRWDHPDYLPLARRILASLRVDGE